MSETNKIFLVSDVHTRNFYKPVLQVKDSPVIFMGDYMDPYYWIEDDVSDEQGIENLKEIFDFARNNKNVKLLAGNHDEEAVWSRMGFSRTDSKFYPELHKLYRDNIDLLNPIIKIGDTIFTHAGINAGWVEYTNHLLKHQYKDFQLTEDNIISFIENEWNLELKSDKAPNMHFMGSSLNSYIFCIGRSRSGDSPYGGPFWSDFYEDYNKRPFNWNLYQICSHQGTDLIGCIRVDDGIACVDSQAIFEYYPETHLIKPSEINDEKTKRQIREVDWKGRFIRFREDDAFSK